MEITMLHKNENSVSTHNIYLVDYTFTDICSKEEQELLDTNEVYSKSFEKCLDSSSSSSYSKVFPEYYGGVVRYLPRDESKDITKSAEILLYVYNRNKLSKNYYKMTINLLIEFINENNIKAIRLNAKDVYESNSIDLVNDLLCCECLETIEVTE